ncbi:unnamed protein product [Penicillium camemberti]|uniref:Str. FM013 n=1 Tax=Penicillium camemberti (strain FM 013) TaxID=1429867 RepID=A0A0G4NUZ1_PENC3|nr:unnamed protein product [Penicillium camemberti]
MSSRYYSHPDNYVGDGTGIQGRFRQSVGQTMSAMFSSLGYGLAFADFKSYRRSY